MPGGTSKRPGRPLVFRPIANASAEVNQLAQALIELINRAETTLGAIAESEHVSGGLKALSRQLGDARGPYKHIVLAIVQHCAPLLGEPADQLSSRYTDLWNAARGDYDGSRNARGTLPAEPAGPEPIDPALVVPVLELVADGDDAVAASVIAQQYPEAGPTAGRVIAEIGRRIPDGTAGLLAAIVNDRGYDFARTYMEAFAQADEETAAGVLTDPRLQPPALDEPPDNASTSMSILDKDPADLTGQRRAAMIARGSVVQVVADLIHEAEFAPLPEVGSDGKLRPNWARREQRRRGDPSGRYDIQRATDLVVAVIRNATEDTAQILSQMLNTLVTGGHAELAARVLGEVSEDGVGEVLDAMTPHALLEALKLLAWDSRLYEFQPQLPSLMAWARPLVVAQLLLEREQRNSQTPTVDLLQLRSTKQVLAEMLSRNALLTASFISKKIEKMSGPPEPGSEEATLVGAVRDVASADLSGTGQLLGQLLNIDMWAGTRFTFQLAVGTEDDGTLWMAAEMLAAAIRLNQRVPDFIFSLMKGEAANPASINMLLDHLIEKHADQGREVVKAMLREADPASTTIRLRELLHGGALGLASEILRQISESAPNESRTLLTFAVRDGDLEAAIDILEHAVL